MVVSRELLGCNMGKQVEGWSWCLIFHRVTVVSARSTAGEESRWTSCCSWYLRSHLSTTAKEPKPQLVSLEMVFNMLQFAGTLVAHSHHTLLLGHMCVPLCSRYISITVRRAKLDMIIYPCSSASSHVPCIQKLMHDHPMFLLKI